MSSVPRHKTAIKRKKFSVPLQYLIDNDFIKHETSVFDYGCGRGDDVALLCEMVENVRGWDPHFAPTHPKTQSDVVMLNYVINVIEDPAERKRTILDAWSLVLPGGCLMISTRVGQPLKSAKTFGDGQKTSTGTFQKIYQMGDFCDYVLDVLHDDISSARFTQRDSCGMAIVRKR